MKKIIIAVVVALVLVGALYLINKTPLVQDEEAMIKDAYFGRGSIVCDFISPQDGKITAYIKSGNVRFLSDEMQDFEGDVLLKDGVYYFWQDQEGMKMSIEEGERDDLLPFIVREGEVYSKDLDEGFNCRRASIDDDMFEIPEDVDFFDFSEGFLDMDIPEHDEIEEYEDMDWEEYYKSIDPEMFEGMEDFDLEF